MGGSWRSQWGQLEVSMGGGGQLEVSIGAFGGLNGGGQLEVSMGEVGGLYRSSWMSQWGAVGGHNKGQLEVSMGAVGALEVSMGGGQFEVSMGGELEVSGASGSCSWNVVRAGSFKRAQLTFGILRWICNTETWNCDWRKNGVKTLVEKHIKQNLKSRLMSTTQGQ